MRSLGIYGLAIPSTHDASSLGQIKYGLEIVSVSDLRTVRKLRLASVSEARGLGYAILASKFIVFGSC